MSRFFAAILLLAVFFAPRPAAAGQMIHYTQDSTRFTGYVAFAADLYRGQVAHDEGTAHQLMSGLVEEDAIRTLRASADFLRSRDDVRAQAIGVIGWCMGGKYAIRLAAADPGIRACVMY